MTTEDYDLLDRVRTMLGRRTGIRLPDDVLSAFHQRMMFDVLPRLIAIIEEQKEQIDRVETRCRRAEESK